MSRKNRNRGQAAGTCLDAPAARQEVERLFGKRAFKEALKQAKICFRTESTPDHHRLLERAYLWRAQELSRIGMPAAAAEVAGHLLDFGLTDSEVLEEIVLFLPAVGLTEKAISLAGRLESPETRRKLTMQAADQAVLHAERIPANAPPLRDGAQAVRAALTALDSGDEARAGELLRDIPRSSPFADWRYFVRGLAAFWRNETEAVAANWNRLEPERAAFRIVRRLRDLRDRPSSPAAERDSASSSTAERLVFGEPVLDRLDQLGQALAQGRWMDVIRGLGPLSSGLRRIDVRLSERLTAILIHSLIGVVEDRPFEKAQQLVNGFTRAAQPLPIDPRWNRLHAILCEINREPCLDEVLQYWQRYVVDLETVPTIMADDRPRVQALVHRHLAEILAIEAGTNMDISSDDLADNSAGDDDDHAEDYGHNEDQNEELKQRAVAAVEESLRLDPENHSAYAMLIDFRRKWNQPQEAAASARRLLQKFSDDVSSLRFLVQYHDRRSEPELALPFVARARALQPLDAGLRLEELRIRRGLARQHGLAGRWDAGRAEYAWLESHLPAAEGRHYLLAQRAALELKAGEAQRAEELIREAGGLLAEPTLLWLELAIEAARYELAAEVKARFDALFQRGLAKKTTGETAGDLARVLYAHVAEDIKYSGRETHVRDVVGYLKRATRVKFRREDMLSVCRFLYVLPNEKTYFQKILKQALKKFPDSAWLLATDAQLEFEKGPLRADVPRMRSHLEKALQLVERSNDPDDVALIRTIKETLSLVNRVPDLPVRFPFPDLPGDDGGFSKAIPAMFRALFGLDKDVGPDDLDAFFADAFSGPSRSRTRKTPR